MSAFEIPHCAPLDASLPSESTASDGTPYRPSRSYPVRRAVAISAVLAAAMLFAYDRLVVGPRQRLGVVDIASVYHAKEDEYTRAFVRASATGEGGKSAALVAQDFARRLPAALDEIGHECRCVIVVRGAVASIGDGTLDLTSALRAKLGMQP